VHDPDTIFFKYQDQDHRYRIMMPAKEEITSNGNNVFMLHKNCRKTHTEVFCIPYHVCAQYHYTIYGIWYMVYGIWYMVYGILYIVYCILYIVFSSCIECN
jgi:hypothetical protein